MAGEGAAAATAAAAERTVRHPSCFHFQSFLIEDSSMLTKLLCESAKVCERKAGISVLCVQKVCVNPDV